MQNCLQKHAGFNVEVKSEINIEDADAASKDLCISLGGDNTFLKTASIIKNSAKTAIIGINSHPERYRGKLCSFDIPFESLETQADHMMRNLKMVGTDKEADHISWDIRNRIHGEKH